MTRQLDQEMMDSVVVAVHRSNNPTIVTQLRNYGGCCRRINTYDSWIKCPEMLGELRRVGD